MTHETEDEQRRLWNGVGGCAWVDLQEVLDQMFAPLEGLLVAAASARSPRHVLDVGCGTGGTTLALARALGATARCTGIDLSNPMLDLARARAARENLPATFVCADAQTHTFDPASVDSIVSRFGVMFFDDPVAAFANFRRASRDRGELHCIAWRSAQENPFMTTAERAAAPLLPSLPERRPDEPGQFSFANRQRVHAILEEGGWADIDIQPIDVTCTFPEKALVPYVSRLGPVGRLLQEEAADERTRARVIEAIRPAFDQYVHGDDVRFTAACWKVGARAVPHQGSSE